MIRNKIKNKYFFIIPVLLFLALGTSFGVEAVVVPVETEIPNPLGTTSFTDLAGKIIDWVTNIALVIAVIAIIYAGFLFMSSRGEEDKILTAKKTIFWALIGIAIIIIGKGFIGIIKSLLGAE